MTYGLFPAYWPLQTQSEFGIADTLDRAPKYVGSSTLKEAATQNITILAGNVVAEITTLKHQPGASLRLVGSAILIQLLMQAGLVDDFWLLVHPVVKGIGERLCDEGLEHTAIQRVEVRPFSSGFVLLRDQDEPKVLGSG